MVEPSSSPARHWIALPLRAKLLATTLLGFVATVCVALLSLSELHKSADDAAFAMATHMATTLAMQVRYVAGAHAQAESPELALHAQRLIDFVHEKEEHDLELVTPSLKIVADAEHEDIGKTLQHSEAHVVAATLADGQPRSFVEPSDDGRGPRRQVVVALPRGDGTGVAGALVFEYTELLEEMQAAESASRRDLLWLSVPVALVLVFAALWGSRSIARSVQRLRLATLGLANGQRPERIGVYAHDELGDLARAFDQMAAHVVASESALRDEVEERRRAQADVQAANETLEQRVLERTSLLTVANQRLDAELAERRKVERQLEQLARFDPLTGLPNRSLFLHHLERAIQRCQRTQKMAGLMFVDMDRFKSINDSLGHEVGDRVLQQAAERLRTLLRQSDIVSRIGGDEFTVIVEDVDSVAALETVAHKLVEGFRPPLMVDGSELFVTLSIGVAVAPQDSTDVGELMKKADFAMYYAKSEGRNGFQFHSETMGTAARERLAIEHGLRHALERDEFALHYQVRVSAKTGRPVGMEALLRWTSPVLGAVSPVDFIPVAEETGLILPLGEWVLRTACAQHVQWRRDGLNPGVMAINVSARQFKQPEFATQVAAITQQAGARPTDVELEVTESMLMSDPENAAAQMGKLRALGFGIAVDDFGTGYSSLSNLKLFPATRIKIDRSFVRDIDRDPNDAAIASAIVALASSLSIPVTAEGVETSGQLARLSEMACGEYQGFLFSKPLPADDMREVLRRGLPEPGPPDDADTPQVADALTS